MNFDRPNRDHLAYRESLIGKLADADDAGRLAIQVIILVFAVLVGNRCLGEGPSSFERTIQPLLQDKCGKCHSDRVLKAGLDLSTLLSLSRGGESGEPLIAESIDTSLLWSVIESGEMPPEDQPALTDQQRRVIRRWITADAQSEIASQTSNDPIDQHDVLPIVLLRCNSCHGPRIRQNGVDLRTRIGMIQGGKNGPAMIPGDADSSPMIRRIESNACPPSKSLLKFFVKRPTNAEVKILRRWIDSGAPRSKGEPDIQTTQSDRLVTDEDRQHWAFQAPKRSFRFDAIDDFIIDQLDAVGLEPSPQADRDTLIRRAYLDLIGLPPGLDQYQRWRNDDDPNWYAMMVDRLLASDHYGERWGRYWLDVAGYADSEGGISADPIRSVAWKYRDYVIRAFNEDKPYDRFLLEQIAGDELVDYENTDLVTEEIVDNLIATGFLRMGIDETGSRTMNFVPERLKVISDAITVVSSGLMGLTMECARCHSHKYDPIPHRDYYRLKAVFQGAFDEHDWSSFKTRMLKVATPEHRQRAREVNPPLDADVKKRLSRQTKLTADLQTALLRHHYPQQDDRDNQATLVALKKADNNRTLKQKNLVERLLKAELQADSNQPDTVLSLREQLAENQRGIDRTRRKMVPSLSIRALWDFGRPSPTYILRGGEHDKPGDPVGPGVPSVLTDGRTPLTVTPPFPGGTAKTGRRLAFARWLTDQKHPLTARVMINRIWHHHFGTGLVNGLDNFGIKGRRPSHPELLDWLAIKFIDSGWSVKQMHRLIMNSRAYRQSSEVTQQMHQIDPENRHLARMNLRRLDAETIRDSLLFVAGKLDDTPGGIPDTVSIRRDGLVSVNQTDGGGWRRSVYLQYRRTEIPTMMDTFDYPQMGPNCSTRNVSTVSPQALMLMNNERVRELASAFAHRVETTVDKSGQETHRAKVSTVYKMALSRRPSEKERTLGVETLKQLESQWQSDPQKALETYCHTILNSASFLFVD